METLNEKQLLVARQEFTPFLSLKKSEFAKLKLKTPASFFKQKMNTSFESLGCIGYHSQTKELTATIHIKRATGYSSGATTNGSYEYVRFYLNYQDGEGWEDMGVVGVNVNNIPTHKDCDNLPEKPIDYVVRLAITPKRKFCSYANLPLVRAVLSWNSIPEENDPGLIKGNYVWSDKKEAQIQIEPLKFFFPDFPILELDGLLNTAIFNPNISLSQLALSNPDYSEALKKAKYKITSKSLNFNALVKHYKEEKVAPHRFGYSLLKQLEYTPYPAQLQNVSNLFEVNNISIAESLAQLNKLKCNTDYEELMCVGADYNREALIGTIKVKKSSGYSGGLCSSGSKEYVSFYVQTDENCDWTHAGTTSVNVYDIKNVPEEGLFYSAVLPYKFPGLKKDTPKAHILKVRAILSWNVAPSGLDCVNYGNVVESYIPVQPQIEWNGIGPRMVAIGGVKVEKINSLTGLTLLHSVFRYTALPVKPESAFGGLIVVEALTNEFEGQQYKIKTTNLSTGETKYITTPFRLDDDTSFSYANSNDEFTYYGDGSNNSSNIVARFRPGTDDKLRVTIEHLDGTSYSKVIQMDSTRPKVVLTIENYGNCSHFVKGSTISGHFEVEETHLESYTLKTSIADTNPFIITSGDESDEGDFSVVSSETKNCGDIVLQAVPRTIVDSRAMHRGVTDRKIICLKDA